MYQLSIQFFWPLTEQIPLDLDYTDCEKPTLTVLTSPGQTIAFNNGSWGTTTISNSLRVGPDEASGYFKLGNLEIAQDKPNLLRRLIYKLLGFDWKQK